MIEVQRNFNLITLAIDGEERTLEIDKKEAWAVMEVTVNGEKVTVHEGNQIEFITESGEIVSCVVEKITGKGEKTKLQVKRFGSECQEIWEVSSMTEIKIIVTGNDNEEVEDNLDDMEE